MNREEIKTAISDMAENFTKSKEPGETFLTVLTCNVPDEPDKSEALICIAGKGGDLLNSVFHAMLSHKSFAMMLKRAVKRYKEHEKGLNPLKEFLSHLKNEQNHG